jgi:internalin A
MSDKVKLVVDGEFDDQRVGHLNLLSPAELRRRMKACLSKQDLAAVWEEVFYQDMEKQLPGQNLGTCIAALYNWAKRGWGGGLKRLLATLSNYSKLYEPLADTSQQVHTLIVQAATEGWKELDLSCCRLSNIPQELANLTALESLNLAGNAIETITLNPEVLPKNLQKLDLRGNEATSISDLPINLTALTILDLSFNELTALPDSLGSLLHLKKLVLRSNQLIALPAALGKLAALEFIDLSRNRLTALPDSLGKLLHLKQLDLSNNKLTALPVTLGNLAALESLFLFRNQLTALPDSLFSLLHLKQLDLRSNKLTALPPTLGNLAALESLDLFHNQLTALPNSLFSLLYLKKLDLSGNQLTALPPEIQNLKNLTELDLRDTPLADKLPPELLRNTDNAQAILDYYCSLQKANRQLNEAKVLIVGQPTAGKTSLVKRLIKNTFDANEAMTEGINVKRWPFKLADDREIRLNIWDFGGQEIMHATHQFFLTKRSLYIILIDAREGEDNGKLEYWLKTAQKFGDNAPVLVVVNKIDIHPLHLNRRGLQDKYKIIKGFLEISCKDNRGIDQLKDVIREQLTELKHVDDELPETWFNAKQSLEEKNADYFSYKTFEKLCKKKKVREESQEILIELLHDLGTVICFYKDWRLQDTHVLNPEWVTNGVYKIVMNRKLIEAKGVLNLSELRRILPQDRYPKDKHRFIIEMMRKFELCFAFDDNQDTLLIPDLFAESAPPEIDLTQKGLLFTYKYDLLPRSIISRFIVRMKAYIQDRLYWRSGVKLVFLENQALVWADLDQKKIYITVTGKEQGRRYLLQIIQAELQEINKSIPNLQITELIPLPEYGEEVEYQRLLNLQRMGEDFYIPTSAPVRILISRILEGIEELPSGKSEVIHRPSHPPQGYLKNTKGLVFLLRNRLDLDSIRMIWFLLFREKLDDVLPGTSLDNAIIEMIARAEKKQLLPHLLEDIITERSDLKEDIDNLRTGKNQ